MIYLVYFLALWKILEIFVKISKEINVGILLYINHKKQQKKSIRRVYR